MTNLFNQPTKSMVIENKEIDKDTEEEEQQLCFRGRGNKEWKGDEARSLSLAPILYFYFVFWRLPGNVYYLTKKGATKFKWFSIEIYGIRVNFTVCWEGIRRLGWERDAPARRIVRESLRERERERAKVEKRTATMNRKKRKWRVTLGKKKKKEEEDELREHQRVDTQHRRCYSPDEFSVTIWLTTDKCIAGLLFFSYSCLPSCPLFLLWFQTFIFLSFSLACWKLVEWDCCSSA